jgi:transposase
LCPWPQVPLAEGEWAEACEAIGSGAQVLLPSLRAREDGEPDLLAQGDARPLPMALAVDGKPPRWTERRLVGRSVRQAKAAEGALRARVAKAKAQGEAWNQRGRGRKRFEEVAALRQAAHELVQRQGVEDFWWRRYEHHWTTRRVRAYRDWLAQVTDDRHATVEVRGDEEAREATGRRWGGRMEGTKQPQEQWSLAQAVLASRHASLVERSCGRLKGCPLSLSPMYVQRDEHATGLMRLLSMGVRGLTLLECVARRQLTAAGAKLAGL